MDEELTNTGGITAPQLGGQTEIDLPVGDNDSGLANPFLANIPEMDRRVVEKYVKDWDAGVTKRFQEYTDKIKVYDEFGDVGNIQTAMTLMQELSSNPVEFVARTQEFINENPELFQELMDDMLENEQDQNPQEQQQYDPNERNSQEIQELRSQLDSFRDGQEEQEQLKMLDNVMEKLHTDSGPFNDEFVLLKISQGLSPEDAVKSWNEAVGDIDSRKGPQAPRLLPGQGGTPLDQVDKSKLSDPVFRKEYGAELLRAQFGR